MLRKEYWKKTIIITQNTNTRNHFWRGSTNVMFSKFATPISRNLSFVVHWGSLIGKKKKKDLAFMKDTQIKRYTLLQVWKSKLVYVQQIQLKWSVNIYGKAFSLSLFLVNGLKVREIANLHMGKEAQIKWLCNKFTEKTSRKHRINKHYKYILNQWDNGKCKQK